MKKRVFILLATLLLVCVFVFPAGALSYGRGTTTDTAGGIDAISDLYNEIYDTYGVDAYFVTATEFSGEGSAEEYANVCIGNLSSEPDRIVFVHTLDENYILPEGKCEEIFTGAVCSTIYNACAEYITAEDYGIAATAFFAHVQMNLAKAITPEMFSEVPAVAISATESQTEPPEDEIIDGDVKEADEAEPTAVQNPIVISPVPTAEKKSLAKPIVICLVIGAVIALISVLAVKGSYKPVRAKTNADDYLIRESLQVTEAHESFTRKETSERKLNNDSSKN